MEMIYQLSANPIDTEHYISASDYENSWFVPAIAEYVSDEVDRRFEIETLLHSMESRQVATADCETNSFTLLPNAQDIYFTGRYRQFRTVLTDLMDVSEETFIGNHHKTENIVLALNACFADKFGTYIATDEEGLIPLDEFIRGAEIGKPYYVGGVVGYHI